MQWAKHKHGFTIVELLIVIVVIAILATLVIVSYNGIKARADDASLQATLSQANRLVLSYKTLNGDALPDSAATAGLTAASNQEIYYRRTPNGKDYCLAANMLGDETKAYSIVSTSASPIKGTCEGYVLVPGNTQLGTTPFWVMKYEATNISNVALSKPSASPWLSISQVDAISTSAAACSSCHLLTEPEWMTIAADALSTASNWSGGAIGSGYVYNGHVNGNPSSGLGASTDDNDGLYGITGGTGGAGLNNRRTLSLSNGEVLWDLSGNAWEWTQGTIAGGQQPGISGESSFSWKQWTNGSLLMNGLPAGSRPSALASTPGLSAVTTWSSTQAIGQLDSNYTYASARAFYRGGAWHNGNTAGVLALDLSGAATGLGSSIGFRVARQ